jgi:hypothetical protein
MPSATAATVSSFGTLGRDFARHEAEDRHGILARRDDDLHRDLVNEHAVALADAVHRHGQRVRPSARSTRLTPQSISICSNRQPLPFLAHVAFRFVVE